MRETDGVVGGGGVWGEADKQKQRERDRDRDRQREREGPGMKKRYVQISSLKTIHHSSKQNH